MGYTLVYGILKMINFAHSEVFMSGPFTAVFLAISLSQSGFMDQHPIIGMGMITILSAAVSAVVAVLPGAYRLSTPRAAAALVAADHRDWARFFLQYVCRIYGSGFKAYPTLRALQGSINFLGVQVFNTQLVVIFGALVMMVILYTIVQRTKIGKAMRAVSEDKEAAELMGIDVDRVIVFTFAMGGAPQALRDFVRPDLPIAWFLASSRPASPRSWASLVMWPVLSSAPWFWGCSNRSDPTSSWMDGASPRHRS
jgi:branched-chain amino acid transport system permease protein